MPRVYTIMLWDKTFQYNEKEGNSFFIINIYTPCSLISVYCVLIFLKNTHENSFYFSPFRVSSNDAPSMPFIGKRGRRFMEVEGGSKRLLEVEKLLEVTSRKLP